MIWTANSAKLTTCEGAKKGIEAFRSVEFVVGQGHFLTASNKYADIVLPITTNWEREGSFVWDGYINRDTMLINRKVVDPYFEAVSDTEACIKIGEKFGLTQDDFFTVSETQRLFNAVATCSVVKENGVDWENLCSITQEDIDEWGVEGEPQEGRVPIAKFMEDGVYRVDRHVGDNYGYIDKQAFREDPEANPIATNSGKVEFYCQTWADCLNSHGYSDEPYSPIPKYPALRASRRPSSTATSPARRPTSRCSASTRTTSVVRTPSSTTSPGCARLAPTRSSSPSRMLRSAASPTATR